MCGIVGLLVKRPELRSRLGELMVPMLIGMTERGPDSSGMAVFTDPVAVNIRKLSLYCAEPRFDWKHLEGALSERPFEGEIEVVEGRSTFYDRGPRGWCSLGSVGGSRMSATALFAALGLGLVAVSRRRARTIR